jgi:serine/threonine-protein kinase
MTDPDVDRWQKIERLYYEAVDLDEAERDTYLAQACPDDEALRQEVRSLLVHQRAADRFLEQPALAEAAWSLAREARAPLTGRRISGHDVASLIGAGGMGEVYRARDSRLGRDVALKVLEPSVAADPEYRRRFEREAQSASALNHPNIVTIYSVGEEDDVAFITMELVQGQTLRQLMTAPISLPAVLDIAVQLAAALGAAHAIGIVHRDLKPENIMVTPNGLVKVLDFGIARRDGAPDEGETTAGTLAYMSPEQVRGRPAGPASDQFSLGAVLYELLTGKPAFQRESRTETLDAIVNAQPAPIQTFNPDAPAALRQIVTRCLSKQPESRFPAADDLERALRQARDDMSRRLSRRQLLWIGAGTAAAAVAGGATWMLWPPPTLAVLPFANLAKNDSVEHLCLGLTRTLIQRMHHLPVTVKSFSLVANFAGSASEPRAIGRQLGVGNVVAGSVVLDGGHLIVTAELIDVSSGALLWKNRYDQLTAGIFKLWDELATAIVDEGLHLRLTRDERREMLSRPTDNAEAFDLFLQGRRFQMGTSEDEYVLARRAFQMAVDKDPRFAQAWLALGGTYWTSVLENYIAPVDAWPQVDRCIGQAAALNPRLPDLNIGRALKSFYGLWNWREADRAWQVAEAAPDSDIAPELLLTHALARWALGDSHDALRLVRRARLIDPLSPLLMLHESSYLLYTGRAEEAAALVLSVVQTHPDLSAAQFTLAEIRRAQGQFDQAIEARRRGHALRGDSDDELDAVLAGATGADGYAQIEAVAVRRLELRTLQRRARDAYVSPLDFARAYAQLDDPERAFGYLGEALTERSPGLVFLNVDRAWETIRADPRFAATVRQVGLPA